MSTMFINSENSKKPDPHRPILNLLDQMLPNQILAFTIHGKISAPTWNEEFELPDRSYPISDIQDHFKYILKKHEAVADNPSIKLYVNIKENRVTFKIKLHLQITEVVLTYCNIVNID